MSRTQNFKKRLRNREKLCGTFLKTPHYVLIEVFAQSGFDFICLDAEHAPFDRAAIDQCCAVARALDFPLLVRVGDASHREILWALDCRAVGIVVPHVKTVKMAEDIAKAAKFGLGGRGYAGSSRWAGYATRAMPDVLRQSRDETVVIAQIEEPSAVPLAGEIAKVDGIDALFAGPADLTVGFGLETMNSPQLNEALATIGKATESAGIGYASFVADAQGAQDWSHDFGVNMFFISSEHNFIRNAANALAKDIKA